MKKQFILNLVLGLSALGTANAALLASSTSAPSSNIIDSQTTANSFTKSFDYVTGAKSGRGSTFSTGDNTTGTQFEISSITIKKNGNQTFNNGTLNIWIFQGSVSDWTAGNGAATDTATDIYDDTTVTPLRAESLALTGTLNNNAFLTLQLDSPLLVDENSEFGFMLTYHQGDSADNFFQLSERSVSTSGQQLRVDTSSNSIVTSRDLVYFIEGSAVAVPEPSSTLLLSFAGLGLLLRRKR